MIGNYALNDLWDRTISPRPFIKTSILFAKMIDDAFGKYEKSASEGIKDWSEKKLNASIESVFHTNVQDFEVRISEALDFDGVPVMTPMKLDRATKSIPKTTSIIEVLAVLSSQKGKILLPRLTFESNDRLYVSALRKAVNYRCRKWAKTYSEEGRWSADLESWKNDSAGHFSPFADATMELIGEDPLYENLMAAFTKPGYYVVSGGAGVRKGTNVCMYVPMR